MPVRAAPKIEQSEHSHISQPSVNKGARASEAERERERERERYRERERQREKKRQTKKQSMRERENNTGGRGSINAILHDLRGLFLALNEAINNLLDRL